MERIDENGDFVEDGSIKVKCVDNYQGEENHVIILCLTRSKLSPFVGEFSRVYVSISRAKSYMVVLGNKNLFDQSETKNGLWPEIYNLMKQKYNEFGEGIIVNRFLKSIENENDAVVLKNSNDLWDFRFDVEEKKCNHILDCGHQCPLKWSHNDNIHKLIHCYETCLHKCEDCGAQCQTPCFGCKHICYNIIDFEMPYCHHINKFECSIVHSHPETLKCQHPCEHKCSKHNEPCRFLCGHNFTLQIPKEMIYLLTKRTRSLLDELNEFHVSDSYNDSSDDSSDSNALARFINLHNGEDKEDHHYLRHFCNKEISEKCPICGSTMKGKCGDRLICTAPCSHILECGHQCPGTCNDCCRNGHKECNKECTFIFPFCDHKCEELCKTRVDHDHIHCPECKRLREGNNAPRSSLSDLPSGTYEMRRCHKTCPNCHHQCLTPEGELCLFDCEHNRAKKKHFDLKRGEFYFRFDCGHFVKMAKAKADIRKQLDEIFNKNWVEGTTPNPLQELHCPMCNQGRISPNSQCFKNELDEINKFMERYKAMGQKDNGVKPFICPKCKVLVGAKKCAKCQTTFPIG